jgi:hypothetical protein
LRSGKPTVKAQHWQCPDVGERDGGNMHCDGGRGGGMAPYPSLGCG